MYDCEPDGGTLKAQNYYRFGKCDDLVIKDVRLNDTFPALVIVESASRVVFQNCYFPWGIILYGFYDTLVVNDSTICFKDSDINARKIEISNSLENDANLVSFRDCKFKFLTELIARNAQVRFKTINELRVLEETSFENSDIVLECALLDAAKLSLKGKVTFDMDSENLCYDYYPLSKIDPSYRPGLSFSELDCVEGAEALFSSSWNEMILLNGKAVDPRNTSLPENITGLEDFYLRKGPDDPPGEAFCY